MCLLLVEMMECRLAVEHPACEFRDCAEALRTIVRVAAARPVKTGNCVDATLYTI